MTSRRLPASCGWGACQAGGALAAAALGQNGEMEGGAFAGVALDPDLAAQQLGQAFADGQAQAGAAVVARGGGIHLLEGLEQPVLPVQRDADAGVAHREMKQPLFGMAEEIGVRLLAEGLLARRCAPAD